MAATTKFINAIALYVENREVQAQTPPLSSQTNASGGLEAKKKFHLGQKTRDFDLTSVGSADHQYQIFRGSFPIIGFLLD